MAVTSNTTTLPATRRQIEQHIDLLIDLLDTLDDPDAEPSLGWPDSPYDPTQTGPDFCGNANAGDDREEADDLEPGEDSEASLGWTDNPNQASPHWCGVAPLYGGVDLEEDHDGCEPGEDAEPDVDAENSLGWGTGDSQTGSWSVVTDLEQGVGAVRKKRPKSRTGAKVCRGCAVLI